ncbi:MAG: type IV toxin-antitoxin system AbiEi family antitoxin [Gammaproteobacteria bacterium]
MDNALPLTEDRLLTAAMAAAQPLGLHWTLVEGEPKIGRTRADALVRLRYGGEEALYAVAIKRALRPATLGAVIHQLEPMGKQTLLVTDYVTPPLAEELRARGVAFIDTAGNAYLENPPLLVWVKGQRRQEFQTKRTGGRAFRPTGLQVLFVLLCKPEVVNRPYREIATLAGVAHGTVGWVMAELPKLGFVIEAGGKRRLVQGERLLEQWVEAYVHILRPKLMLGRYRADKFDWLNDFDPTKYDLQLGGEPAAARLTQYLRPATATFYGERIEPRLLLDHKLRADVGGNVEVLKRFWNIEAEQTALAPTLLIYADLLAIGDARCLETANLLYDRVVAGLK